MSARECQLWDREELIRVFGHIEECRQLRTTLHIKSQTCKCADKISENLIESIPDCAVPKKIEQAFPDVQDPRAKGKAKPYEGISIRTIAKLCRKRKKAP